MDGGPYLGIFLIYTYIDCEYNKVRLYNYNYSSIQMILYATVDLVEHSVTFKYLRDESQYLPGPYSTLQRKIHLYLYMYKANLSRVTR